MSMIRLEHDNFAAAERLVCCASAFECCAADADASGDQRSTTYVCSAAHEAALGGEEAAIARGRAQGRRHDDYRRRRLFPADEALGGKLIARCLRETVTP